MARHVKPWHPKFLEYMEFIVNHPHYQGLPINRDSNGSLKWVTTGKSDIGKRRKSWAEAKARELGIPVEPGVYAKVMYAIHPTKVKVCQICGEEMFLGYIYPNANFAKAIHKTFNLELSIYDSIYDVWDAVVHSGTAVSELIKLINLKFGTNFTDSDGKDTILKECEALCRLGGKRYFGPGAMSDFPDRYDGFHTYNRCHRPSEDSGRSAENLKSYTRDRRAYEYWSDGNIHAANKFMGSARFKGASADHVGPISLGFVHDSHYLRVMLGSDNSTKRDRLSKDIIESVVNIHKQTGVYPMSWYSALIWDFIVENYKENDDKIASHYRALLKQNMANFMFVLKTIADSSDRGRDFLVDAFITPKRNDFMYSYTFDGLGNITAQAKRHITERASGEFDRFARIALLAVDEYSDKTNRQRSASLTKDELSSLDVITTCIVAEDYAAARSELQSLVSAIQNRLIRS